MTSKRLSVLKIAICSIVLSSAIISATAYEETEFTLFDGLRRTYCIKVTNVNEFPDVVFVGYTGKLIEGKPDNSKKSELWDRTDPLSRLAHKIFIREGVCLRVLNKPLKSLTTIYAVKKSYVGDKLAHQIDLSNEKYVMRLADDIAIKAFQYNGVDDQEVLYTIAGFVDNKLIVYMSKRTKKYANDTPDEITTFPKPNIPGLRKTFDIK